MGKVIIVTGGSRGIGKAVIEDILGRALDSVKVITVARTGDPLKELQDKYGSDKLEYVVGDITSEAVQEKVLQIAVSEGEQGISSLVANAGVLEPVDSIGNYKIEDWKRHFDINFFSVVSLVSKCLPHMAPCGNIIMVSSGASVKAYKGWSCYCASKAALNSFTLSVATEYQPSQVKAIAIAPGVVATQMQEDIRDKFGPTGMPADALKRFTDLYDKNQLLDASVPGHVYAEVALAGIPAELSGLYLRYNDERLPH